MDRFANLIKIPPQPAARLLAADSVELDTPIAAPAASPVEVVLRELDSKEAWVDMVRLLAVALPARERVWWACIAARDMLAAGARVPPPLAAAEAWVFKPTEENRALAHHAFQQAAMKDDSKFCAMAVQFHDGTLGPGDLAKHPAPPGGSSMAAFAMNITALPHSGLPFEVAIGLVIERGLDIGRGGSGQVKKPVLEGV
ncbi:hypothetical protein NX862_04070 [Rhodobacter sp. KR11]|jgi:hypothetical protein|uniref:DUF6931 family protein n=1 Tax=Rhodobacter sp. KR11 TaxID=2974588 RepID=UPI002221AD36|nr:hypothetical protein [Rhodobacter sp. KR11]MCW1917920.1 hypothetical protein [Rhodobacter sp. KR11]